MSANPFDEILGKLDILRELIAEVRSEIRKPPAEWETLPTAAKRRRRSPRTIIAAAEAGDIEFKREPRPGGRSAWLLRVADLDRHFPARM